MRALYIHLHCAKENGKSPIVAKLEAAAAALESGPSAMNDADGVIDPSRDEANEQLEALDINSLRFTNDKTQAVYVSYNMLINLLKFHTNLHRLESLSNQSCTASNVPQ